MTDGAPISAMDQVGKARERAARSARPPAQRPIGFDSRALQREPLGQDGDLDRLAMARMASIGRLASGIAHDFNSLLTVIGGCAQLLAAELSSDDPARADAEEIIRASNLASALTRQLLAFARPQPNRPEPVDVNDVVRKTIGLLRRLIHEDIEIVAVLEPCLTPIMLPPAQLEQVIVNLAINARDAMPHGGRLLIETAMVPVEGSAAGRAHRPDPRVRLRVADTGGGMDAATRARLFEPFFTTKGAGSGTGIGLSTVRWIVARSQGRIAVTTAPGAGSTFEVIWPAAASEGTDAAAHPRRGRSGHAVRGQDQHGSGRDSP